MKTQFKMRDLGLLSYLGIEIQQSSGITLCQAKYTVRILEMTGMRDYNHTHTQMEEWLKLSRKSTAIEVDTTEYRRLFYSFRYLAHTRPDLSFSVRFMSLFMEWPTQEYMVAVKRIMQYVSRMINYGFHFVKEEEGQLISYRDNDLIDDIDTRKTTSGALFFYGDSLVS
ncbi:uncharacterized mitochondrial protein AtMg00810-like [Phragmites australis]|uniref:uncharacterized mitochondrial protein AtMg00810-like n=1 Tax=Phragmites australis TaxID=29695 RepID=UPI002D765AB6|nr:uncharacterized mitochondrial protein AtMg00810-like [Phragmites australis]